MTEDAATVPKRLTPFFSAPFRPRATIRQLAGSTSVAAFLALCGAVGAANTLLRLGEASTGWQDWQAILVLAFITAMFAALVLYVASAVARMVGRLLGGHADNRGTRSALAWGTAPLGWGALVATVLLALRWQTGNVLATRAGTILLGIASLWSLVTTIAMLMEVERFGVIRAIITYTAAMLVAVFLVALPIRVFLWQPFNIPSGAQTPTLIIGDHLFVSKYAYGYSRFSFPFSPPLFKGRILSREPKRGDVVVFKLPRDNRTDYIKRIVGLPGDTIQLRGGLVYINGDAVPRRRVEDYPLRDSGRISNVPQYEEILPSGVTYRVLDIEPNGPFDNTGLYKVPAGHYFMMGDNRGNSTDSRAQWGVGYVPFENLVGRAEIIFLSVSEDGGSRAGRMLTRVR